MVDKINVSLTPPDRILDYGQYHKEKPNIVVHINEGICKHESKYE